MIRNLFRRILRVILSSLASVAIKKHKIQLIVVTGSYKTRATKELIYAVLSEHTNTRRNIDKIWWDLSVPLNILGYEDKERSVIEWFVVLVKSVFVLVFSPSNKHNLVLDIENSVEDIQAYWSNLIFPNYFVILDTEKKTKYITDTLTQIDKTTKIIMPKSDWANDLKVDYNVKVYGEGCDLGIVEKKENIMIDYQGKKEIYQKRQGVNHSWKSIGAAYQVAIEEDLDLDEIFVDSLKFELPLDFVSKLKVNLAKENY